jgi:Zn-dependent M28 family amino/carboxypeptidase
VHKPSASLVAAAFVGAAACSSSPSANPTGNESATVRAEQTIDAADLLQHIKDISDDSTQGRAPGTPGEQKATAYMQRQFAALGLKPGNPNGTWFQNVDLIGYTAAPIAKLVAGGRPVVMRFPDDYVAMSRHDRPATSVDNSDIIFVGYGVIAPEYGWDDYKGQDVKGKTILMLVNDPPVTLADDSTTLDTSMFKGKAMTYYGRYTYKYEIASMLGAAAAIVIHQTGPAGYPWEVVKGSFSAEQFDVPSPDAEKRVPVEGWMTAEKAKELFRDAGFDFDSLQTAARHKDFKPLDLKAKATWDLKVKVRKIESMNVVARLEGTTKKDEYVIYTAHWDHLGRDTSLKGDQIFNGALDNASGSAGLLEIAKAYTKLTPPPERSILFLSVTGEEKGLLGSKFYAQNPLYPLTRTAADINMDGLNQWGPTKDLTVVGYGNSTLDDVLTTVLAADGRTVRPDAEPEKGFYYRSDHFEFAQQGVPALDPGAGIEYVGKPEGYGMQKRNEYTTNDYHKVSDQVKPDWDLSGAVEDLRVFFRVGVLVANAAGMPEWKSGTEFKAKRDSMMAAAK